jgi:hypothetical protein
VDEAVKAAAKVAVEPVRPTNYVQQPGLLVITATAGTVLTYFVIIAMML